MHSKLGCGSTWVYALCGLWSGKACPCPALKTWEGNMNELSSLSLSIICWGPLDVHRLCSIQESLLIFKKVPVLMLSTCNFHDRDVGMYFTESGWVNLKKKSSGYYREQRSHISVQHMRALVVKKIVWLIARYKILSVAAVYQCTKPVWTRLRIFFTPQQLCIHSTYTNVNTGPAGLFPLSPEVQDSGAGSPIRMVPTHLPQIYWRHIVTYSYTLSAGVERPLCCHGNGEWCHRS